jgi:chromosome segregation ATPase
MESRLEEQEESARKMDERVLTATEEYNSCMRTVEDMETDMASMKQEEQMLKCNLKRGQEECARLVAMFPSVEEERKLEEAKEKVRLVEAHILDVSERAKAFFAEYDAMYEDAIQKLKGQMSRLVESLESLEHEPKE